MVSEGCGRPDEEKTREQLLHELTQLREQLSRLQSAPPQADHSGGYQSQLEGASAVAGGCAEPDHQEILALHLDNSPLAVIEWDRHYRICRWAGRAEDLFGWTATEMLGQQPCPQNFVHPDDQFTVQQAVEQLLQGRVQRQVTRHRNVTKSGAVIDCEWYSSVLFDAQSNVESVLCLVLDVTGRQQAEIAVQEAHRKTFSVLETISEGFASLDSQWRFTYLNPQGERILGVTQSQVVGQTLWMLFPDTPNLKFRTELQRTMQSQLVVHFEEYYPPRERWLACHAYPLRDGGICIYYQDISNQKQLEHSLKIYQERLDLVLRVSELGVWFCDLPFSKLEWNDKCKEHFGLPPEAEVTIDLFYERLHPDDRLGTRRAIARAIETHSIYDSTYRTIAPCGRLRWIHAIGSAFYDEQGRPVRFDGITVDVTTQKQQEEERDSLLQREQSARQLAELNMWRIAQLQQLTASLARAMTTAEISAVLLNQGLAALGARRGWVTQRLADRNFAEIVGVIGYVPEEIEPYRQIPLSASLPVTDAIRTGQMVIISSPAEYYQRYPTLAERYVPSGTQAAVAIPLMIENRVIGSLGLSFAQPRQFSETDCAFMITLARQCAQALERARLYESERLARAAAESANRVKDEFLAVLSHELRSPLNPILGWAKMLRSRQFDEQMTARALETIERNAKLQTQLIEDLLDVSRILQGKLLLNISQVSLVSTIEAALETVRHAAESRTTDLRFLILATERNGTSSQTAITAWQNGISEKAAEAYHAGFTVSGDSARLQQIVWNLVSNAVKFTPAGGKVEVKLEQIEIGKATVGNEQTPHPSHPLASSPPQSYAQITVTDTGKGIHPDFLPYVFDYFRQADSTTTRQYGGLGLGLAIVRHLVELHGGSIRVESAGEGQGATFIVMLPLLKEKPPDLAARSHAEPAVETAEPDAVSAMTQTETAVLQGVRVLVVDDDADMREYAAYVLQQAGANVTLATSAGEVLAKLSRVKPDVLVSDIGMPNVDGYALLRQIRSLVPELGGQVPAIAVTAYAGEYDQQRAQEAGFQLHVPKPVDPEVLIRAVVSLLAER